MASTWCAGLGSADDAGRPSAFWLGKRTARLASAMGYLACSGVAEPLAFLAHLIYENRAQREDHHVACFRGRLFDNHRSGHIDVPSAINLPSRTNKGP